MAKKIFCVIIFSLLACLVCALVISPEVRQVLGRQVSDVRDRAEDARARALLIDPKTFPDFAIHASSSYLVVPATPSGSGPSTMTVDLIPANGFRGRIRMAAFRRDDTGPLDSKGNQLTDTTGNPIGPSNVSNDACNHPLPQGISVRFDPPVVNIDGRLPSRVKVTVSADTHAKTGHYGLILAAASSDRVRKAETSALVTPVKPLAGRPLRLTVQPSTDRPFEVCVDSGRAFTPSVCYGDLVLTIKTSDAKLAPCRLELVDDPCQPILSDAKSDRSLTLRFTPWVYSRVSGQKCQLHIFSGNRVPWGLYRFCIVAHGRGKSESMVPLSVLNQAWEYYDGDPGMSIHPMVDYLTVQQVQDRNHRYLMCGVSGEALKSFGQ